MRWYTHLKDETLLHCAVFAAALLLHFTMQVLVNLTRAHKVLVGERSVTPSKRWVIGSPNKMGRWCDLCLTLSSTTVEMGFAGTGGGAGPMIVLFLASDAVSVAKGVRVVGNHDARIYTRGVCAVLPHLAAHLVKLLLHCPVLRSQTGQPVAMVPRLPLHYHHYYPAPLPKHQQPSSSSMQAL